MTKVEFLLLLLVVSQFMQISIEIARLFIHEGYLEDEENGGDDNE